MPDSVTRLTSTLGGTGASHLSSLGSPGIGPSPVVRSSTIPAPDHVLQTSVFPPQKTLLSSQNPDIGTFGNWRVKVFPAAQPTSRADVVLLEQWLDRALDRAREESASQKGRGKRETKNQRGVGPQGTGGKTSASSHDRMQQELPAYSMCIAELSRQVRPLEGAAQRDEEGSC